MTYSHKLANPFVVDGIYIVGQIIRQSLPVCEAVNDDGANDDNVHAEIGRARTL